VSLEAVQQEDNVSVAEAAHRDARRFQPGGLTEISRWRNHRSHTNYNPSRQGLPEKTSKISFIKFDAVC